MRAKQYLSQARGIEWEIRCYREEERATWDRLTHITQNYESDGAQSTKDPHKFDAILAYVDRLAAMEEELAAVKAEILLTINQLPNRDERMVLVEYYIKFKKWERVALDLNFSYRKTMRHHARALNHIDQILEGRDEHRNETL